MLPLALLGSPRNAALAALALALALTGAALVVSRLQLGTRTVERDAALQRVAALAQEVRAATAIVGEARSINSRQAQAIERHRRDLAAAETALAERDRMIVQRDRQVREAAAAVRQRDRERRALPDVPVEAMNDALRDAAAAL